MPRDWNGALGIFLKALRIDRLRGWFCRHVAMNGFPDFCGELPGLMYLAFLLTIEELPQGLMVASGYAFIIGIAIFSGSLYALSLTGIKSLGAITPIGGIAMIIGWLYGSGCFKLKTIKIDYFNYLYKH
ncbi:MAG: DUF423 domain-containing protein [Okeania sp. SIO3B3]|nr:DUF423 domain-containing protein [Okeania sp. SIO3B3]